MQVQNGHERLVEHYVEQNLSRLHLPYIPLSAPSYDETLLLNCHPEASNGRQKIVIEVQQPGEQLVIARRGGGSLQVREMNQRSESYGQELFHEPIEQLALTSLGARVWQVNIDRNMIRHQAVFDMFLGHISQFALGKQHQLDDGRCL